MSILNGCSRVLLIGASLATLCTVMATAARSAQATASQRTEDKNAVFEAVSIKAVDPDSGGRGGGAAGRVASGGGGCGGGPTNLTPGRIVFSDSTVLRVIAWAYGLDCSAAANQGLITGVPSWARADHFVIEATFPSTVSVNAPSATDLARPSRYSQVQQMLRNMLADRFKLVMHRDNKEIAALELVVSKGGPKFPLANSSDSPGKAATPAGAAIFRATKVTMEQFALTLQDLVRAGDPAFRIGGEPIVDRTGLTDEYRIDLYFAGVEDSPPGSVIPPLFTALQEQLGLKLQRTKATEDVVVIDQLEKPTAN